MSTPNSQQPQPQPPNPFLAIVTLNSNGTINTSKTGSGFVNGVLLVDNTNSTNLPQYTSFSAWKTINPKTNDENVAITFDINNINKNVTFKNDPFNDAFVVPDITTKINKELDSTLTPP